MNNYFNKIPPFETKKPYEFKDAIMINAIKHYQKAINEKVFIVSNDKGFCNAFDDDKFITMNFIGELFRYVNLSKIEDEFDRALEFGDFDNILYNYFSGLDIDLGYYIECKVNNVNLYNFDFDLMYLEEQGDKYLAHLDGQFELLADIKYRDEEMSYHDKEEQCYLIEEFVTCREKHVIDSNVVVACSLKSNNGNYNIIPEQIQNEDDLSAIDLDEDTFCWSEPIDIERMENEDLICCSECGKPIWRYPVYTDYYGEPLCDDCMVTNSNGEICSSCGRKVPSKYMNSGYCNECNSNID